METAAKIVILLLALFFSLIPAGIVVLDEVEASSNRLSDLIWLFLGWWLPFALPVALFGFVMFRHRDTEHGSNVDEVFK